ncbi:hypothetical protein Tco_1388890 [Tanacetum coccineum]
MSFSKRPGKNTPRCYTKPLDSLKNWNNRFFLVHERVFPTVVDWRINAPKDEMPVRGSYSAEDVAVLNTRRTPIQKQLEALLCIVGLSWRYFLGDDVYPTFLNDDDRGGCFAPNPTKVRTGTRPCAPHEVPLLTATANCVIAMEDATVASGSSGTPSTMEKSPLDFANKDSPQRITEGDGTTGQAHDELSQETPPEEAVTTTEVIPDTRLEKEVAAMGPPVNKRRRKRDNAKVEANAPPKVLRKDHAPICPEESTHGGKSLAAMGLEKDSTFNSAAQETPAYVSDPEPLSSRVPTTEIPAGDVATIEVPDLFSAESPESKRSMSVTSACQDIVDHTVPSGYFSEIRHLPQTEFLAQYNINLARQVALGSQLRLRFEQEVRLLKKVRAHVARRNERIQTLLEAEVDMKKATEAKNAELAKELESLRAKFLDLELNNNQLSQQVFTLQAQVTGEERIKAAFEEFKKYEDDKVEKRCAEMDARLDALSIEFDEELYPHMLTAIAGRRWVIGHGLHLAVMKCAESIELRRVFVNVVSARIAKGMSEGLEYGVKQGEAKFDLAAIKAYNPEADNKYIAALHALKSDTGEDAPQWIRELRPSSSHLTIPVYPEGLAILLADAATQTDISEDEASPRLLRSKSLLPMYNLDWP